MRNSSAFLEEEAVLRSPNEERRASVRYKTSLRVACRLVDGPAGGTWKARIRDLSTLGIGLLLKLACRID